MLHHDRRHAVGPAVGRGRSSSENVPGCWRASGPVLAPHLAADRALRRRLRLGRGSRGQAQAPAVAGRAAAERRISPGRRRPGESKVAHRSPHGTPPKRALPSVGTTPRSDGDTTPTPLWRRVMAGRWIEQWDPEDETFWKEKGERIARRNLFFSVLSEHIGFSDLDPVVGDGPVHGTGVRARPGRQVLPDRRRPRWSARWSGCRTPSPSRGSAAGTGRSFSALCLLVPTRRRVRR